MRILVFDVNADYAHFKKPYSPMSPVSYPFPPPTAVLGMLGAVLGYGKEEYHERLGWEAVKIAVRLSGPVRTYRSGLNLLNTKDGTDSRFRPLAGKNTHIQLPFEFLKNPSYRIYVGNLPGAVHTELAEALLAGWTRFTPSLGVAQCIADLTWAGDFDAVAASWDEWDVDSVCPLGKPVRIIYEDRRKYHRLRVPAVMDGQRIVHRYEEVIVVDDGRPIHGKGSMELFQLGQETIAFI